MKKIPLPAVLSLLLALAGSSLAQQPLHLPSCSYLPGFGASPQGQIGPPAPPLTNWQSTLVAYFNQCYGQALPALPILTLHNENNARAGGFGVALNVHWLASMGKPMGTAILAHELGHVCQAYRLIPIDQTLMQWGLEGQADYFAGRLLAASGFPQQAFEQGVLPIISQWPGDQTHAPGQIRAWLTATGYYQRM
jgi:hypothetical protein